MEVYLAKCTEFDPELDKQSHGSVTCIGVFSTREKAEEIFSKKIEKIDPKTGKKWFWHHICFEGEHEVEEFVLDII